MLKKNIIELSDEILKYLESIGIYCANNGFFYIDVINYYKEPLKYHLDLNSVKREVLEYLISKGYTEIRFNLINEALMFIQIKSAQNIQEIKQNYATIKN